MAITDTNYGISEIFLKEQISAQNLSSKQAINFYQKSERRMLLVNNGKQCKLILFSINKNIGDRDKEHNKIVLYNILPTTFLFYNVINLTSFFLAFLLMENAIAFCRYLMCLLKDEECLIFAVTDVFV